MVCNNVLRKIRRVIGGVMLLRVREQVEKVCYVLMVGMVDVIVWRIFFNIVK